MPPESSSPPPPSAPAASASASSENAFARARRRFAEKKEAIGDNGGSGGAVAVVWSEAVCCRPYLPGLSVLDAPEAGPGEDGGAPQIFVPSVRRAAAAVLVLSGTLAPAKEANDGDVPLDEGSLDGISHDWKVEPVGGGVTNRLYRVHCRNEQTDGAPASPSATCCSVSSCLVRVFGGEGLIDRDAETVTFAALADQGLAPPYFGRLENARVEGWCDGMRPLAVRELGKAPVRRGIAGQMARLHATFSLQGSEELALGHDPSRPVLWTQLDDWLQVALRNEASTAGGGGGGGSGLLPTAESIRAELDWARGRVAESAAASGAPRGDENPRFEVAFCHNDVLAANVLWDDISRTVQLIDFEYGGYNYAAFDLANHFNERAGGPPHDSVPDYGLFPSAEEQREFLSDYLLARDRFGGGGGGGRPGHRGEEKADEGGRSRGAGLSIAAAAPPVDPARLTALGEEVRFFVLVNHLYWGLWALNQSSSEGNDVYDYLTYAVERFRQYYKSKHQMAVKEESKGGEGGEGE